MTALAPPIHRKANDRPLSGKVGVEALDKANEEINALFS